jgi:ABC-type glycerol-3-phosphate transport system substrate-binding protein
MNKMKYTLAALVAAFGLASCAGTSSSSSASGVKPYPRDVYIVTDNKLGSMGDPITIMHEGQEVKFCCKPCVAKFRANPEKYLSKL